MGHIADEFDDIKKAMDKLRAGKDAAQKQPTPPTIVPVKSSAKAGSGRPVLCSVCGNNADTYKALGCGKVGCPMKMMVG